MTGEKIFIHPTAVVDAGVQIGAGTRIWHFSHVMEGARIGERCVLGQNVFVGAGVQIGNGVKIQNNVSVYAGVSLDDDVFVGPSVVFTNVINPRSHIERKEEFMQTVVGRGATIGANATILCGVTLGPYSFIGAGAVVTRNAGAYELWYGNPARCDGWMSARGCRLEFDSNGHAQCAESGELYRIMRGIVTKNETVDG